MSLALAVWDIPRVPVPRNGMYQVQQTGGVKPFYEEFGI